MVVLKFGLVQMLGKDDQFLDVEWSRYNRFLRWSCLNQSRKSKVSQIRILFTEKSEVYWLCIP